MLNVETDLELFALGEPGGPVSIHQKTAPAKAVKKSSAKGKAKRTPVQSTLPPTASFHSDGPSGPAFADGPSGPAFTDGPSGPGFFSDGPSGPAFY